MNESKVYDDIKKKVEEKVRALWDERLNEFVEKTAEEIVENLKSRIGWEVLDQITEELLKDEYLVTELKNKAMEKIPVLTEALVERIISVFLKAIAEAPDWKIRELLR